MLISILVLSGAVAADDAPAARPEVKEGEAQQISGMSIVGNSEAPKSLTIVPWKGSDVGAQIRLRSSLLEEGLRPVDRAVFMREIAYFDLGKPK